MLRELQTFVAIVRDGTFSRAGERLGLTQSAVSAQVKRLEEYFRMDLFHRGRRQALPTEAGRRLLPLAEEIISLVDSLPHTLRHGTTKGCLRIGAINTAQLGVLPDAIVRYKSAFPLVELHISPGVSSGLFHLVEAGKLDLAIIVKPTFTLPGELEWQQLWGEPYVLVVPPTIDGHDIRTLLSSHPFLRYDRSSYGGRLVHQYLTNQQISVHESMELDELEVIVHMVERGLGISIIPASASLGLERTQLRVIELGDQTFYREIGTVGRKANTGGLGSAFLAELRHAVVDMGSRR